MRKNNLNKKYKQLIFLLSVIIIAYTMMSAFSTVLNHTDTNNATLLDNNNTNLNISVGVASQKIQKINYNYNQFLARNLNIMSLRGEEIIIKPGDDIQHFIDNAKPDDKLILTDGSYDLEETLEVHKRITIQSQHKNEAIINSTCDNSVFNISDDAKLDSLNITGRKSAYGGGVYNNKSTVIGCTFIDNTANNNGGGVYNNKGTVTSCTFIGNTANYGGGVYNDDGTVTSCTFIDNTANNNGGGVCNDDGTVTSCTFIGNTANYGGGVYNGDGTVTSCTFIGNTANNDGGGVYNTGGTVNNSTIMDNVANRDGGGTFNYNNNNMIDCIIKGNTANNIGGGAYISGCTISNCIVTDNTAKNSTNNNNNGGGIYSNDRSIINNSNIANNTATYGGGVVNNGGIMNGCNIMNNTAERGGGIYNEGLSNTGTINGCNIMNNTATIYGGGIDNEGSTISNCNISSNNADSAGGGVYNFAFNNRGGTISNCNISSNNAADSSGGVHNYNSIISNSVFRDNMANNGGGVVNNGNISNCTFISNKAGNGGGVYYDPVEFSTSINNCTFIENYANHGGGISTNPYIDGNTNINNCIFTANRADLGGGLYSEKRLGDHKKIDLVSNSIFTANRAIDGGGIYNNGFAIWINCNFSANIPNDWNTESTNLTIDPVTGVKSDVVKLTAHLTNNKSGISNKIINFSVADKFVGKNTTDDNGVAIFNYKITESLGIYNINATFISDDVSLVGSTANNTLTVNPTQYTIYIKAASSGALWSYNDYRALNGVYIDKQQGGICSFTGQYEFTYYDANKVKISNTGTKYLYGYGPNRVDIPLNTYYIKYRINKEDSDIVPVGDGAVFFEGPLSSLNTHIKAYNGNIIDTGIVVIDRHQTFRG